MEHRESSQALVQRTPVKRKRRMRSIAEKKRLVEETLVEGVSVAEVARRHAINANLLFGWRRLYQQGLLEQSREPARAKLLPVKIAEDPIASSDEEAVLPATGLELVLPCGITLRLNDGRSVALLPEVLSALGVR